MKNSKIYLYASTLLLLWGIVSCDIKKNKKETDPKTDFIKVYENNTFSDSYIPIDIQQTSDGGYLILAKRRISESSFYGVYLMKTDALGAFVQEEKLTPDFVNPVYSLMKLGSDYYFFTMNSLTLEARLMRVSENGSSSEVATITDVLYPLYASLDASGSEFVLQHYNVDDKRTVVSKITTAGVVSSQREFNIGFGDFDVEEPIIDHLTGNGKDLPFLCGSLGNGTYFFNGFYNYTLSTVFFNSFGGGGLGLLQGYKDERCISSLLFLSNGKFALSRYASGENYVNAAASINYNSGAIAGISSLSGNLMLELNQDASVVLKKISVNGKSVVVYNTDTKSGQIILYFYDENSGALLGTKYFGYTNAFKGGSFLSTADGGLALVGTTYLAGRFPRIALIKVSKEELEEAIAP